MNAATGGIEKSRSGVGKQSKRSTTSKLAIPKAFPTTIEPGEAIIERDPETGKIIRVVHSGSRADKNPLNDPLNSDSDSDLGDDGEAAFEGFGDGELEEVKEGNEIVRKLEELASRGAEKKPRAQSQREREWIEALVARWGDDYGKMAWDRRLNPMQQTEADIRTRVAKWRAGGGRVAS